MIGVSVEQIGSFKHLSTFVDSKLNFNDVVMKARERRFIMKNFQTQMHFKTEVGRE